jgi:hypothetical protein
VKVEVVGLMFSFISGGDMKSNDGAERLISDLLEVTQAIYLDACASCLANVSDLRDLKTIRSRVKDEGVSFLTITLPQFARDFERSLANGQIDAMAFRNFRKVRGIPAFLSGILRHIFDLETGRIHDELPTDSDTVARLVDSVRQICLAFKKMELECTPARTYAAFEGFIAIEQSFDMFSLPEEELQYFDLVSSVLWDDMLGDLRLDMLFPRHGPGATAERISGNQKFIWQRWHERLELYFPFFGNAVPLGCALESGFEDVSFISQELEQPVRVTPVPKTLKAPRIIAIEPCCMQYVQQGIRNAIYRKIESFKLTKGHVNFADQTVNQELAMMSSHDGRFATIDLSDASDRVPHSLAMRMFRSNQDLRDLIDACRSTRAEMPDGRVIGPLRKFASMGSALCFPIEAMYFYTICVASQLRKHNLPVSRKNVFLISRGIYIYGDDIVVPTDDASTVLDDLQKYNCKVNTNKSFWTGKFRESCGVDAYDGRLVTPIYIITTPPENRQQAKELISWTETARSFFKKGYLRTSSLLFNRVEQHLGPLPELPDDSPGLGRIYSLGNSAFQRRWSAVLQRFEVKAWCPRPVIRTDSLVGYAALNKSLSVLEGKPKELNFLDLPSTSGDSLASSALYGAVAINRRWVPAS